MTKPSHLIAIGASAGGVEALSRVVRGLPADLNAAVVVVLHVPMYAQSRLPDILSRSGQLPAKHAEQGERLEAGRIYVAPPDVHLLVRGEQLELKKGPRENHSRPAIDPTFRSAARAFGPRAIGVILSGALYDGSAGLMAIKAHGGKVVIQDPREAMADSMPRSALRVVEADAIASTDAIGPLLARIVNDGSVVGEETSMPDSGEPIERVIDGVIEAQASDDRPNDATIYTCPDCGGVLIQSGDGAALSFRCHVGHAYAPELLLGLKSDELEAALWTCVRMLTEKATLTRQVASRSGEISGALAPRVAEQADLAARQAKVIQDLLLSMPATAELIDSVSEAPAA